MIPKQPSIRLERLLSNLGFCSRTTAKTFVRKNRITLFGQSKFPKLEEKVDPTQIQINGQLLEALPPFSIALHKPPGYVCSRKREAKSDKLVFDLLPPRFLQMNSPILSYAGRLDKEVTGLVILSQNGALVNSIISPRKVVPKVYHLTAKLKFSGNEPGILSKGIQLGNSKRGNTESVNPVDFELLDLQKNMAKITLKEGKYHQVSRMMAAIGNKIDTLHRVSVGSFTLGDLKEGQWRYITDQEIMEFITSYLPEEEAMMTTAAPVSAEERAMLKELDPERDDFFADRSNIEAIDEWMDTDTGRYDNSRAGLKDLEKLMKASEEDELEEWKEDKLKALSRAQKNPKSRRSK